MPIAPVNDDVYTGFVPPDATALAEEGELVARDLGARYRLRGFIARGGFASVWSVIDQTNGDELAVKRLDPRLGRRRDFYRELRAMFVVEHPNVVRIVNLLEAGGTRYLFLELCHGGSLRAAISRARRASATATSDNARQVVEHIARGLSAVHERGFTHRDLKPENVLFADRPTNLFKGTVKLADFGLTDLLTAGAAALRGLTGSPAYMAPEQFTGGVCPASDVYALGVIGLELLTGELPFLGTAEELAAHHLWTAPPLPASLSSVWADLLPAMLAKAPSERPTAAMVVSRLAGTERSFQTSMTGSTTPMSGRLSMNPNPMIDEKAGLAREAKRAKAALDDLAELASKRRRPRGSPALSTSEQPRAVQVSQDTTDAFFGEFEADSHRPPVPAAPAQNADEWFSDEPALQIEPTDQTTVRDEPVAPTTDKPATPPNTSTINDVLDSFNW
ncbi:MAG: hypothetical protein C0467_05880 [Planctomycetaceae bacterium]|nr:hypothetical protein [Planctomycetaceae bacterium]